MKRAIEEYEQHLLTKGNRPRSISRTLWALRRFLGEEGRLLSSITARWCEERYLGRQGVGGLSRELAADSHRNLLAEVKTFLTWCCDKKRRWLPRSPVAELIGVGRRNPGGKGKKQLRLDEWSKWTAKAQELAVQGEVGAVAAALAGEAVDASAIVTLRVRDVDRAGTLLWVGEQEAKTEHRRRPVVVPAWLTPHLLALCEGAPPMAWLFRTTKGGTGHPARDWPRHWVQKICDQAGVPRTHAHGMRGLAATLATLGGADKALQAARERLGHEASSTSTQASYAADEAVDQARAEARNRVLQGEKTFGGCASGVELPTRTRADRYVD